jgi:hypothetical protein
MSITLREPLTLMARIAIALEIFLAIGALGGGAALLLGPCGEILALPMSVLDASPFADYSETGGVGRVAVASVRHHRDSP